MEKKWQISDKDIVPDETQDELEMIRSRHMLDYFRIGDIANRLVHESAKAGMSVTADRVHKAVGRYCGKKPRTVRYYAENAIFFGPTTRNEYDMLPFSFFDFARTFGNQWKDVLDWAAEHPDYSLAQLRHEYSLSRLVQHDNSEKLFYGSLTYIDDQDDKEGVENRCAQSDLNRGGVLDTKHPFYSESVTNVRKLKDRQGMVNYFHLIADMGYFVALVESTIETAEKDGDMPKKLLLDMRYHVYALQDKMRNLAKLMEKKQELAKLDASKVSVDLS
jgi:hypothetical protein